MCHSLYGRMPVSGLTMFMLSYAPELSSTNLVSLFILKSGPRLLPVFPPLLSSYLEGRQHPLDHSVGSLHSHLEARNSWWLWHFLFIDMAWNIFIISQKEARWTSLPLVHSLGFYGNGVSLIASGQSFWITVLAVLHTYHSAKTDSSEKDSGRLLGHMGWHWFSPFDLSSWW